MAALHAADSAFDLDVGERKYVRVGRLIAARLPERAVVFSLQHSGGIRYYSGRTTIRYDQLERGWLDSAFEALSELGYRPYILLEEWEEPLFRARFAEASPLGHLDWPPAAAMSSPARVRLYDPEDRAQFAAGLTVGTQPIP